MYTTIYYTHTTYDLYGTYIYIKPRRCAYIYIYAHTLAIHLSAFPVHCVQRHQDVRDSDMPYAEKLNVAFWRGGARPANRCGDWTARARVHPRAKHPQRWWKHGKTIGKPEENGDFNGCHDFTSPKNWNSMVFVQRDLEFLIWFNHETWGFKHLRCWDILVWNRLSMNN